MIYLDNAATTKAYEECNEIINKYNTENYFNPSAMYKVGFSLQQEFNKVRENIIKTLQGEEDGKVIFTGSATEANNLAIFGSLSKKQGTYIFSSGEHPSVYNCAMELMARGYNVKFISLNKEGEIDLDDLKSLLEPTVCFVSLMLVNNETGAINPIKAVKQEMMKVCPTALLHVDAVQGFCKIPVSLRNWGVDLCTISAHKIYGPKGIGALYISKKVHIKPVTFGGGQENNLRPGTYNTAGIMALNYAIEKTHSEQKNNYDLYLTLREKFLNKLDPIKNKMIVNCENGAPYILSLSFDKIRGETLLHMLEQDDIIIGTGSACSASKIGNRVLEGMGRTKSEIQGSIRISFGIYNTIKDIEFAAEKLVNAVNKLYTM